MKKKMVTGKLIVANPIDDIEQIISNGFDLVRSIQQANWSYNNEIGLNAPTLHMREACQNFISTMKKFNWKIENGFN